MSEATSLSGFAAGLPNHKTSNPIETDAATGVRRALTTDFETPSLRRSLLEAAMSFGGFAAVCMAMYLTIRISVWIAMPLALLAAGFLVRIFIIQHDCGHGSFFRSRHANRLVGWVCSVFTLTPYASWRRHHAGHHRMWNNLDRRRTGVDIYSSCMTVAEYRALSRSRKFFYRLVRNPLIQNIVLPPLVFLLLYRLPFDTGSGWSRERWGIQFTNLAIVFVVGGGALLFGWEVVLVQLPIMILASIIGVWLFSVQHRFENSYWARQDNWTPEQASIRGSSHLILPKPLQWFTGNIGLHHVHHLNTKIPNYRLQNCHDSSPAMQNAPVLTFWQAIGQSRFALWDEGRLKMVSFRQCSADQKAAA